MNTQSNTNWKDTTCSLPWLKLHNFVKTYQFKHNTDLWKTTAQFKDIWSANMKDARKDVVWYFDNALYENDDAVQEYGTYEGDTDNKNEQIHIDENGQFVMVRVSQDRVALVSTPTLTPSLFEKRQKPASNVVVGIINLRG